MTDATKRKLLIWGRWALHERLPGEYAKLRERTIKGGDLTFGPDALADIMRTDKAVARLKDARNPMYSRVVKSHFIHGRTDAEMASAYRVKQHLVRRYREAAIVLVDYFLDLPT